MGEVSKYAQATENGVWREVSTDTAAILLDEADGVHPNPVWKSTRSSIGTLKCFSIFILFLIQRVTQDWFWN